MSLLLSINSIAQNPNHYKIGEEEFFNKNIYTLFQDSNDILYIGTDKGLFIHKQNKFISIKNSKQIGNSFFSLKQNNKKELFCKNLNGQIFKIKNDTLILYYQLKTQLLGIHFNYYFDSEDRLITVSKNIQRITDNKTEILFHQDSILKIGKETQSSIKSNQTQKGEIFISLFQGDYNLLYRKGNLIKMKKSGIDFELNYSKVYYDYIKNEPFEYRVLNGFYFMNKNIQSYKLYKKDLQFYHLQNDELLVLDLKDGASLFTLENNNFIEKKTFFNDRFLSTAFQNSSGTLFLGTFGDGIIVIPKIKILSYNTNYSFNTICAKNENEVYLGTQNGDVILFKDTISLVDKLENKIEKIHHFPQNIIPNENKGIIYAKALNGVVYNKVLIIDDSCIIYSTYKGVYLAYNKSYSNPNFFRNYKNQENVDYQVKKLYEGRTSSFAYNFRDSVLYISAPFGLLSIRNNELISDTLTIEKKQALMTNNLVCYEDLLICGTIEKGVLFFRNNKLIRKLNLSNGLKSNSIKKVLIKNNLLYIFTTKGIQIWNIKTNTFLPAFIDNEFFNSNKIKDFDVADDNLWLMTQNSFFPIKISSFLYEEKKTGKLYFDSLLVNNSKQSIKNKFRYEYYENEFKFNVDYRNIETKKQATIIYSLKGYDNNWKSIPTTQNLIEYQSLPAGKYTFVAKAVIDNNESNEFRYSFSISAPYWQRWWFYVSLVLLSGGSIYFIAKYRIKKTTIKNQEKFEKEELSKDLAQTKLKALRSQMNPHFIFNSLNAIQELVLKKDTDKSYDYIVLFSELVRNTLNYSDKDFISIEKEIEFIDIYLTLEQLRFGDEMNYSINYEGSSDIKIPSLVVQPFIENALLHGLLHKDGKKEITINFKLKDSFMCEITDNGIGRRQAAEIKQRQHKVHESFSTSAIKKRMEILSKQHHTECTFWYEDVFVNNEVKGTKVTLDSTNKCNL